jgi:hypothetical protein
MNPALPEGDDRRDRIAGEIVRAWDGPGPPDEVPPGDLDDAFRLSQVLALLEVVGTRARADRRRVRHRRQLLLSAAAAVVGLAAVGLFVSWRAGADRIAAAEARSAAQEAMARLERARGESGGIPEDASTDTRRAAQEAEAARGEAGLLLADADRAYQAGQFQEAARKFAQVRERALLAAERHGNAVAMGNAPERIVAGSLTIGVYDDDKECGEVMVRLFQGPTMLRAWGFGRGEDWNDPSTRRFDFGSLDLPLNGMPLRVEAALEERPGEVNIDAGLDFRVSFRTSRGRTLEFSGRHYYRTGNGDTNIVLRGG